MARCRLKPGPQHSEPHRKSDYAATEQSHGSRLRHLKNRYVFDADASAQRADLYPCDFSPSEVRLQEPRCGATRVKKKQTIEVQAIVSCVVVHSSVIFVDGSRVDNQAPQL